MDTGLGDSRPRFVHGRGVLAEGREAALPIREYLNVFEDVLDRLPPRPVLPLVDELPLQCPGEVLHTSVIPTVPCTAHAGNEAVLIKQTLVACGGILTAAI